MYELIKSSEQSRAEQSRAEQSRAEQSRAEQRRAEVKRGLLASCERETFKAEYRYIRLVMDNRRFLSG